MGTGEKVGRMVGKGLKGSFFSYLQGSLLGTYSILSGPPS